MSETGNNKQKKFPEFDCLSTEELIELLRRDSYSDPYDTTKVDAILHISGVIEERTRKEKAENALTTDEAWKKFNRLYLNSKSDTPLYEPTEKINRNCDLNIKRRLRVLYAAAAIALMIFAGSITAKAFNIDIVDTIISWGKETFGVSVSKEADVGSERNVDNEVIDKIADHGINRNLIPTYIPEGYELEKIEESMTPDLKDVVCGFARGDEMIILQYTFHDSDFFTSDIQKNEEEPTVYDVNENRYYIFINNNRFNACRSEKDLILYIFGVPTKEEIIKIISSIKE